jgi:hypothetical protein
MATPFILWWCIAGLVWILLLSRKMADKVDRAMEILGLWLLAVLGILGLPQYFPFPLGIQVSIIITATAAIGITLFLCLGQTKVGKAQVQPRSPLEKSSLEPSLKVEIYQAVIVPEQGSPFKRIYFQVTNTGKSTAPHCRAIIRLPDEVSPYMRSLTRFPPDMAAAEKAFETYRSRLKNIELDWFKAGMTPPEDKYCLGKSVDISPHPNDVFLAGTILANKVELGPVHTVNAKLEISVNTPENWPPKGRMWRPLMELYAGDPLEIKTVFTWEKEQMQERTFRWELQVVSFDDIRFTPIS